MSIYPSLIDLSMHSLQNRCKHSITVRVFLMIPVHAKGMINVPFYTIGYWSQMLKKGGGATWRKSSASVTAKFIINIGLAPDNHLTDLLYHHLFLHGIFWCHIRLFHHIHYFPELLKPGTGLTASLITMKVGRQNWITEVFSCMNQFFLSINLTIIFKKRNVSGRILGQQNQPSKKTKGRNRKTYQRWGGLKKETIHLT